MKKDRTVIQVKFPRKKKLKSSFKFTQAKVDKFKSETEFTYDTANRGLCLRNGETYYTYSRARGTTSSVKVVIGHKSAITLAQAIKLNHTNMAFLSEGINPNYRKLEQVQNERSIEYYVERFLKDARISKRHAPSTVVLNQGVLKNHLKEIKKYTFSSLPSQKWVDAYRDAPDGVSRQMLTLLASTWTSLTKAEKKESENPSDIILKYRKVGKPKRNRRHRHLAIEGEHQHLGMWFKALMSRLNGLQNLNGPDYWDVTGIDPYELSKAELKYHLTEQEKFDIKDLEHTDWLIRPARNRFDTWVDVSLMASLTCLRRQEILDITWDDVDFEEQYFVILEPKGGKGEVKKPQLVPFTDYTEALFKKRKEQTKEIANPYVFYSQFKSDEPMTAQNIYVHSRITGLVMCMFDYKYQRQGREENKKAPIPKAIHPCNLNQQSLTELRKLLDKKKIDIDDIGMHMHDLRRTTGNVAEYLGMTRGTVETMLNHTGKTTATRHYIETQVEPFRKALQICNEYVDNRIAEYLYSETAGLQDETTFQSPILTYLRAEGDAVDKDEYYDNYGGFQELLGKKQSRTKSRKKFIK